MKKRNDELRVGDVIRTQYGVEDNIIEAQVVSVEESDEPYMIRMTIRFVNSGIEKVVYGFRSGTVTIVKEAPSNKLSETQELVKKLRSVQSRSKKELLEKTADKLEEYERHEESVSDFVKRVCDRMDRDISEIEPYAKDGAFELIKKFYVKQVLQEEMRNGIRND